ncbi:MAG TPA: argininosuccinate lyase [Candidatus Pelagibacter bacterium]|jgi:argininosuccinate lyase|nr:argininosuccinate lyase [Pelagibacteraceae bacterium]HJN84006.1 argininosuccinate lyase [Candidatus Pelagibacter bacterium]|tara:strand:- start:11452 stop:12846 length:1395 start_codon:yes stop_codon:yes gene_type:complete
MIKNKYNQAVWSKRIKKKSSLLFQEIGSSINIDKRLFKEDIMGSLAHIEMLSKQKIITPKIKNKISKGLKKIEKEILQKKFFFSKKHEDIHMNIEKRLFQLIGDDAGFIHTARSRNDQVITDFKLWIKSSTNKIDKQLNILIKTVLKVAKNNIQTIMPGFTHLKNAQPVSLAHYLLAYVEMFQRDKKRFFNNLESLNENPLGVAALSGTSFNIDRFYTTKKLGFKKPTNNSIDTVADRDFVIDFLYSVSVCSLHISRIAEELIIWNSDGFNLITLSDKVVTGSSIMPQKKNPDPLEYLRGKAGGTFGNLFSMLTILKGLPLSYFKDLQDDKEIVFRSFDIINNCISILNEVLNNFKPNKTKMLILANRGFVTATDLADHLVKYHGKSFRKSYQITANIVNYAERKKIKLNELKLKDLQKIEPGLKSNILNIFDLKNSINSKKSFGGTSFNNIKKMIKKYKKIYK